MKIESVGVGSTNRFRVKREWLGTNLAGHSTGALVTKVRVIIILLIMYLTLLKLLMEIYH